MSFKSELSRTADDVEKILDEMLQPIGGRIPDITNFARYAALDAGKRLRAFITAQCAGLFDVPYEKALRAGACIEMVHNFSLIHDDLPCIDNDAVRRGRPSVWAKYGESNAILAGDFLLNQAFFILATDEKISADPAMRLCLARELSYQTRDMIIGEYMDIEAEKGIFNTQPEIDQIQFFKTGAIFTACTMFGAILGNATDEQSMALREFARAMGLCFQITDDILDVTGDADKVGKTLHKDDAAGKATYVSLLGLDGAREQARILSDAAKSALSIFDSRADNLREMMDYMITRES